MKKTWETMSEEEALGILDQGWKLVYRHEREEGDFFEKDRRTRLLIHFRIKSKGIGATPFENVLRCSEMSSVCTLHATENLWTQVLPV